MKLPIMILITLSLLLAAVHYVNADGRTEMKKSEKSGKFENWKDLWSDGFEIHLISLPDYVSEKKLYEVGDWKVERLGNYELSPDNTKIAFTPGTFGSKNPYDNLYILDIETGESKKIGYSPSCDANLRGFLGNDRLLLEGDLHIENDIIIFSERSQDNCYLYIYDLNTHKLEALENLGTSTVGMANADCAKNAAVFTYNTSSGPVVYNVDEKKINRINKIGDLVAISPDGQKILFKDNAGYSLIDSNGEEELVLSQEKIKNITPFEVRLRGGYWELHFWSWSPDGKYILFDESADQNKKRKYLLDVETKKIKKIQKTHFLISRR